MNRIFVIATARRLYNQLQSPGSGVVWLLLVFAAFPGVVASVYSRDAETWLLAFLFSSLALLMVADVLFRLTYRLHWGAPYSPPPRIPFDDLHVEPHPYISYVFKRKFLTPRGAPAVYPLHKGRYYIGQYKTNNLRFINGPDGSRDVVIPKPEGLYRINCLGASTTGNYIEFEGQAFSYPMELEQILKSGLNRPVEVNNCAHGGYNSADLLVRYALQVIDTRPDVVIIYHAYNDIRSYLTPNFDSDYSHSRRNLGESYWKYAITAKIPRIPLSFFYFLLSKWLPLNIRSSLLDQVTRGEFDTNLDPSIGLQTYQRNIQHIIDLCARNNTQVVLSTYCHYLHKAIEGDPLHQLYGRIVGRENEVMRHLAIKNKLPLVDNAKLVPADDRYFLDSVHFTPAGMQLIAGNLAEAVKKIAGMQDRGQPASGAHS